MMTTPSTGDAGAAHRKLLAEATEVVSAGVADDLSSEEIAGNVLSLVECTAILARPEENVVEAVARALLRAHLNNHDAEWLKQPADWQQWIEDTSWRGWVPEANAAISACRKAMTEGE